MESLNQFGFSLFEESSYYFAWKVKVKSLSCFPLVVTPWTVSNHAPPSMGFSRQECWSRLPFPSPGDLPNPGTEPGSPTLQANALPSESPHQITILPQNTSVLFTFLLTLVISCHFDSSHSDRCEVISCYDFDLHFPDD